MQHQSGFTLLEMVVAVAILAIISVIGLQVYSGYIGNANAAVLAQNIDGIRPFEEDTKLRTGSYAGGTYNKAGGITTLTTNVGWAPSEQNTNIVYQVATVSSGTGYRVTATTADGQSLVKCFGACP